MPSSPTHIGGEQASRVDRSTACHQQTDRSTETAVAIRNVEGEQRVTRGGGSPASGVPGHFREGGTREYVEDLSKHIDWTCVEWKCGQNGTQRTGQN